MRSFTLYHLVLCLALVGQVFGAPIPTRRSLALRQDSPNPDGNGSTPVPGQTDQNGNGASGDPDQTGPSPNSGDSGQGPDPSNGDGQGTPLDPSNGDGQGTPPDQSNGDGQGTPPDQSNGDGQGTPPDPSNGDGQGTTSDPSNGDGPANSTSTAGPSNPSSTDTPIQTGNGPSNSGAGGPPYFVVYSDSFGQGGPPPVADIGGFNVVALSFLQTNGAQDKAAEWAALDSGSRQSLIDQYHAAGMKVVVSLFGAEDTPTTSGADPVAFAQQAAQFVKDNGLDGVDVDYEDLAAINKGDGSGEQFIVTLTQTLRQELPQGQYLLSHAPLSPWFEPGAYPGGAYVAVNKQVGDLIDFYNIQYYNQGENAYTTCDDLVTKSASFPGTAILELVQSGIPGSKLVIGKPAAGGDATNGFMDPATIGQCAATAAQQGWNGGIMTWEYPDANSQWIQSAKGSAFS